MCYIYVSSCVLYVESLMREGAKEAATFDLMQRPEDIL